MTIRQYSVQPTFADCAAAVAAKRASYQQLEETAYDTMLKKVLRWLRDSREFSRKQILASVSRVAEAKEVRPVLADHPCEIITHRFSDGSEVGRCKGVSNGVRCAYGYGHTNKALNYKKHTMTFVSVSAVDEDDADPKTSFIEALEKPEIQELGAELKAVIAAGEEPEERLIEVENADTGKVTKVPESELRDDDAEEPELGEDADECEKSFAMAAKGAEEQ